jgi:hypothetical protein
MNADVSGVKQIFRKYRSVSHIWATELCFVGAHNISRFEAFQDSAYVHTATMFQMALEEAADTSNWDILSLTEISGDTRLAQKALGRGPERQIELAYNILANQSVF